MDEVVTPAQLEQRLAEIAGPDVEARHGR